MLNQAQKEAVLYKNGPLLVIAGPGSGKTTIIINRTKELINSGVNPENILVVTFTRAAAKEMEERFFKINDNLSTNVTFGTIHSICLKIITTSFGYSYDDVLSDNEKWAFLKQTLERFRIDIPDETTYLKNMDNYISYIKNGEIKNIEDGEWDCPAWQVKKFFESYQSFLQQENKIDYEDMQIIAYKELMGNPIELKKWQQLYQYIMIDEFQDVNKIQSNILYLLANPQNNICIVGDDDQSLYGFRGALPEIMLHFEDTFPETKKIILGTNYRSDKNIIDASVKLIKHNKKRFKKELKNNRPAVHQPIFKEYQTESHEMRNIVNYIHKYHAEGIPYKEMAVIYRVNRQSQYIADQCSESEIPFKAKSEDILNLYNHWIFQEIKNFYEVAMNYPKVSFTKIKNALKRPTRYIPNIAYKSANSIEDIVNWSFKNKKPYIYDNIEKFETDLFHLRNCPFSEFMETLCYDIGYWNSIINYSEYAKENKETLLDTLSFFIEDSKKYETFEAWVQHAKDYTYKIKKEIQKNKDKDAVSLLTMHSSKGLEFQVVFLIDANQGMTPYRKTRSKDELEEERRMFYVGMTRAKDYLHICWTKHYCRKEMKPSIYIKEIRRE